MSEPRSAKAKDADTLGFPSLNASIETAIVTNTPNNGKPLKMRNGIALLTTSDAEPLVERVCVDCVTVPSTAVVMMAIPANTTGRSG